MQTLNYPWAFNSALSLIGVWLVWAGFCKLEGYGESLRRTETLVTLLAIAVAIPWSYGVTSQQADWAFFAVLISCTGCLFRRAWVIQQNDEYAVVAAPFVGAAALVVVLVTEVLSRLVASSLDMFFWTSGVLLVAGTPILVLGAVMAAIHEHETHTGL